MKKARRPVSASITATPCVVEVYAIDTGQKIDGYRLTAKANKFSRIGKIIHGNALERDAKTRQRRIRCFAFDGSALMKRSRSFVARGWA